LREHKSNISKFAKSEHRVGWVTRNTGRPFNYMPLYGARNTGCPQISTKKTSPN
jgi:hypothetical protein